MTPHRCRLPTADQLRARLQGLMDQHDVLQKDLATWLGCSRLSIHRRFAGWRGLVLTVEDAREIAAAILLRGNPATLPAGLRADLDANIDELLAVPQVSRQMLQALMGAVMGVRGISARRIAGMAAEGLIEPDRDGGWVLTAAAAPLVTALEQEIRDAIGRGHHGLRVNDIAGRLHFPVEVLLRQLRTMVAAGSLMLLPTKHNGFIYRLPEKDPDNTAYDTEGIIRIC